jgi:hypothetical protein
VNSLQANRNTYVFVYNKSSRRFNLLDLVMFARILVISNSFSCVNGAGVCSNRPCSLVTARLSVAGGFIPPKGGSKGTWKFISMSIKTEQSCQDRWVGHMSTYRWHLEAMCMCSSCYSALSLELHWRWSTFGAVVNVETDSWWNKQWLFHYAR